MFQILVVEDDRELNKTVCSYLYQNGYQATGCLDANACLLYTSSSRLLAAIFARRSNAWMRSSSSSKSMGFTM